jgi:hypothetical protein
MKAKLAFTAVSVPDHVFGDRRLGDLEPELQQFTVDEKPCSMPPQYCVRLILADGIFRNDRTLAGWEDRRRRTVLDARSGLLKLDET